MLAYPKWNSKTDIAVIKQLSYRLRPSRGRRAILILKFSTPTLDLTKNIIDTGSWCSQLKGCLFSQHSAKGIEIKYYQSHWLCPNKSQSESTTLTISDPNRLVSSSSFFYAWNAQDCCGLWVQELWACSSLDSTSKFWILRQWPKTQYCGFYSKFWLKAFFEKKKLLDIISPNCWDSTSWRFYQ